APPPGAVARSRGTVTKAATAPTIRSPLRYSHRLMVTCASGIVALELGSETRPPTGIAVVGRRQSGGGLSGASPATRERDDEGRGDEHGGERHHPGDEIEPARGRRRQDLLAGLVGEIREHLGTRLAKRELRCDFRLERDAGRTLQVVAGMHRETAAALTSER